ncbi:MAG: hypothetical protein ACHQ53_00010 [Polyangiales bacterium]
MKAITTTGNAFSSTLVSDQGDLYFAIVCRVDIPPDQVGSRTHIMRFRP